MSRSATICALGMVLVACTSAPKSMPTSRAAPAVCAEARREGIPVPTGREWARVLMRGVDIVTWSATTPALDCTGAHVRWEGPVMACSDGLPVRTALTGRPIADADVITAAVGGDRTLVWIITTRFASGDALGPVALVEITPREYRVLATGALRAYPGRSRLWMERLGDREVLVAEGEACASDEAGGCIRSARLLPIVGNRLQPVPLTGPDGSCAAPAWIDLHRREVFRDGTGWERLELTATMGFGASVLVVDEHMAVQDLATSSSATGRPQRRAQSQRSIRWEGDRLLVTGSSLWDRMTGRSGDATP